MLPFNKAAPIIIGIHQEASKSHLGYNHHTSLPQYPSLSTPITPSEATEPNHPKMATNEVYQYSLISALMDGVASNGIPISQILSHGDHGLGTFQNMVGEMIILDGEVYQMKADGSVVHIDPEETITPFATVTKFQPTTTVKSTLRDGKKDLQSLLDELHPEARNHFLAIRLDGAFRKIEFRTAGGQCRPREGMVDVCSRQTTHTFVGKRGTVVGFRCPGYVMGINVAGDHLHFISEDRQRGGHILGFETEGEVRVGVAVLSRLNLELPKGDGEFDGARLAKDEEGIKAVEG